MRKVTNAQKALRAELLRHHGGEWVDVNSVSITTIRILAAAGELEFRRGPNGWQARLTATGRSVAAAAEPDPEDVAAA